MLEGDTPILENQRLSKLSKNLQNFLSKAIMLACTIGKRKIAPRASIRK